MRKSKVRRMIASVLAVVMCFTMVTTTSFAGVNKAAAESNEVNLVTFGDSTTNGFGMPDFLRDSQGFSVNNNYLEDWAAQADNLPQTWTKETAADWNLNNPDLVQGRMSNYAYPWQLKSFIAAQEGVNKVNLTPFNLNGMRTDELRALLDEDFYKKRSKSEYDYARQWLKERGKEWENVTIEDLQAYKGFLNSHVDDYIKSFYNSGAIDEYKGEEGYREAQRYLQESVKNADVIVLDVCGNNFGTALAFRLTSAAEIFPLYAPNTYESIDDVEGLPKELKKSLKAFLDGINSSKALKDTPMVKTLLESLTFCIADCFVNYSSNMEWIMQNKKPEAKVITVGVTNQLAGWIMESKCKEIDLGDYASALYDLVNKYVRAFDKNAKNCYYADPPEVLESFYESIRKADSLEALLADGSGGMDGKDMEGRGHYAIDLATHFFMRDFLDYSDDEIENASQEEIEAAYKIVYTGVREHSNKFMKVMISGVNNLDNVKAQAKQCFEDVMAEPERPAEMDAESWGTILYLLRSDDDAMLIHPNANGCSQKYQAVLEAYLSDTTAYEASVQDLLKQIRSLEQKMKEATTANDFQKIIDRLAPIKEKLLEMRVGVLTNPDVRAALKKCVEMIKQARYEKKHAPENTPSENQPADNPPADNPSTENQPPENQNDKQDSNQTDTSVNSSEKIATVKVALAKEKITSLKKGKKSFVVKWKKVAKADGYQISYKTGKTKKIAKVAGANNLSKKVTKLKAKKKYTVKVRAYKKVAGKMYYGRWSTAKKVTVK